MNRASTKPSAEVKETRMAAAEGTIGGKAGASPNTSLESDQQEGVTRISERLAFSDGGVPTPDRHMTAKKRASLVPGRKRRPGKLINGHVSPMDPLPGTPEPQKRTLPSHRDSEK